MKKKVNARLLTGLILLVSLIGSIIFAAVRFAAAPESAAAPGERIRSDYLLMLVQCAAGLIIMFLPSIIERKFSLELPNYIYTMFFVFLYCAIYLGEVRNFYFVFKHWDTFLHFFSAAMLGALGFMLVDILNHTSAKVQLSPLFVGLFAFSFAVMIGVLWEIYEFSFDALLGLNMQKFRLEDGTLLIGREALLDTMMDFITNTLGALVVPVLGAVSEKIKLIKKGQS
ncbi:MAG: hypothetical protein J6D00_05925 [Christensenellaceae bacterium]|nr:hypothetical protein [Christensenellaceae bacterium]